MKLFSGILSFQSLDLDKSIEQMKIATQKFKPKNKLEHREANLFLENLSLTNQFNKEDKSQQLIYSENDCWIVSNSRIDNKEELIELLNIPLNDELSDNAILLKMYLEFGNEFVKKIEGDWTLAIWNQSQQEILIARDQLGTSALYYRLTDAYFAFSTYIGGLIESDPKTVKIDEIYLAGILTAWDTQSNRTAFENIKFLPPAHYGLIKNGKLSLHRYWIAENTQEIHLDSAREYVERFSDKLEQSVKNRIRYSQNLGSQLSSGFDSSTITTVAAEIFKKDKKRLTAFTSIPKENTSDYFPTHIATDESYLSIPTAQFLGNVDHVLVRSENQSIIKNIHDSIELHHSPLHAAGNMFWIHQIYLESQAKEIDTMIIGQSGNATISWAGYPEGLQIKSLIKRILGYKSKEKFTPISYVKYLIGEIKNKWSSNSTPDWNTYSFINTQFAQDLNLLSKMKEMGHDPSFSNSIQNKKGHINFINPKYSKIGALWQDLAYRYQISTYDPSNDKRLVEYILSVPNEYYQRENTNKWLLKTAMKGRLLDDLIHQTRKGRQATDLAVRIQSEATEFKELLKSFRSNSAIQYYIDCQKMETYLDRIIENPRKKDAYNDAIFLTRGISCALFINKYHGGIV
ncbi:asparagine synthase-related protein [Aquirufa nivalisilvae]